MSKAASSPTARLLQSSRLFSIPRPLPQAQLESITSTGVYRASESATLPYPTHQAIATPPSSHFRGDWGLKRPLPKKATSSSTPHIRIAAQDTPEHITDFGSAADHTQTVAKWQEMGIPVFVRQSNNRSKKQPPLSVFENALDNTATRLGKSGDAQRWKYNGPWIAGMQEGDFNLYTRRLEKRKDEWREYLKDHIVEKELANRRRQAQDEGDVLTLQTITELRKDLRPNDQELRETMKRMRNDHSVDGLSSELTSLITTFLDLPAVRPSADDFEPSLVSQDFKGLMSAFNFDNNDSSESAPPSTHPSAGLSYMRTNAVMDNHPLHGPQAHRSAILARVVRPRQSVQGNDYQAKLGVGGIVANDPLSGTFQQQTPGAAGQADQAAHQLDTETYGGNKMYVHPQSASIDENGRIKLSVTRGTAESIAVKTGDVEPIHESRAASSRGPLPSAGFGSGGYAPPGTAGNANYGYSLPDMRRAPESGRNLDGRSPDYSTGFRQQRRQQPARRPEVRGFDEELPEQGRLDDQSANRRIRELLESRGR